MDHPNSSTRIPIEVTLPVGNHAWCSCGLTSKSPFCDGSHKGTTFRPKIIQITGQPETLVLCQCQQTANPPFCDGSHLVTHPAS